MNFAAKRYASVYVCAVPWKVRLCVWRRLATRLIRLGIRKGVCRHASPYRLKNNALDRSLSCPKHVVGIMHERKKINGIAGYHL